MENVNKPYWVNFHCCTSALHIKTVESVAVFVALLITLHSAILVVLVLNVGK